MAGIDDRRHEDDRFRIGLEERLATLGAAHVHAAAPGEFSADFQELITRYSWGEVWARPDLDRTTRRLITIAMLIASNRHEDFEAHVDAALCDGIPQALLREVFLHAAIYCGLPAADRAFRTTERLIDQHLEEERIT